MPIELCEGNKTPENLGVKIAPSKRAAALERLKEACEVNILNNEIDVIVQRAVLEVAERELKKEKELNS